MLVAAILVEKRRFGRIARPEIRAEGDARHAVLLAGMYIIGAALLSAHWIL